MPSCRERRDPEPFSSRRTCSLPVRRPPEWTRCRISSLTPADVADLFVHLVLCFANCADVTEVILTAVRMWKFINARGCVPHLMKLPSFILPHLTFPLTPGLYRRQIGEPGAEVSRIVPRSLAGHAVGIFVRAILLSSMAGERPVSWLSYGH